MTKITKDNYLNSLYVSKLSASFMSPAPTIPSDIYIKNLIGTNGTITTVDVTEGTFVTLTSPTTTIITFNTDTGTITTINSTTGTITTINSTTGIITTINVTTGNITTVNSTDINTSNFITGLFQFDLIETLTASGTASALVTTTYIDTSGGGAGQVFEITLPTPANNTFKIIILRDGPGILVISGTGISDVIITVANEGATFIWNNDISEWNITSGPLTTFSSTFSGTITVDTGASPDPNTFTSITNAINSLNREIISSCTINVAAGTYAGDILIDKCSCSQSTLYIIGDTRVIVGLSYVDEATSNNGGIANAGGDGDTVTFSGWGTDTLTITMATNPDFDAAGIIAGDKILFSYPPTPTVTEFTIDSVLNNAITITGVFPADPGEAGSALTLLPNRIITGSITLVQSGIDLRSFVIHTTSAPNISLNCTNGSTITCNNCVCREGALVVTNNSAFIITEDISGTPSNPQTAFSVVNVTGGNAIGYISESNSFIFARSSVAIACTEGGYFSTTKAIIDSQNITITLILGGTLNSAGVIVSKSGFISSSGYILNSRNGVYITNMGEMRGIPNDYTIIEVERRGCFVERASEYSGEDLRYINCTCDQSYVEVNTSSLARFAGYKFISGASFPANGILCLNASECSNSENNNQLSIAAGGIVLEATKGSIIVGGDIDATSGGSPLSFALANTGGYIIRGNTCTTVTTSGTTLDASGGANIILSINSGSQTGTWIDASRNAHIDIVALGSTTVPTGAATVEVDSFASVNATGFSAGLTGKITPAAAEDLLIFDNSAGFLGAAVKL